MTVPRAIPDKALYADLRNESAQVVYAAVIAQGLLNRELPSTAIYLIHEHRDQTWLNTIQSQYPSINWQAVSASAIPQIAIDAGIAVGHVLYAQDEQHAFHNVTMLCSAKNAIPALDGNGPIFDTRGRWRDRIDATRWALSNLLSGANKNLLACQNPDIRHLDDFIVHSRMFSFYLNGDIENGSAGDERRTFLDVVDNDHFSPDASVMGYHPKGIHPGKEEVIARMTERRSQLTLVSDYSTNLSFLSRFPSIDHLQQPPIARVSYDPTKTYVAIIFSDGDNLQMVTGRTRSDFDSRPSNMKTPIAWTISNRLADFAPPVIKYFFDKAKERETDTFLMGPSGYGFLDPGVNPRHSDFAQETATAASSLDMLGYVHWDHNTDGARRSIPKYADHVSIRGVFNAHGLDGMEHGIAMLPELIRWRSDDTTTAIAAALSDRDWVGKLGYVYVQPGPNLVHVHDMVSRLRPHVNVVGYRELICLSRQKERQMVRVGALDGNNGKVVYLHESPDSTNQNHLWSVRKSGDSCFLVLASTGGALDADNDGRPYVGGSPDSGNLNHKWELVRVGNVGNWHLIKSQRTGRALDANNGTDHIYLHERPDPTNYNHLWWLEEHGDKFMILWY
ncbi:MAG: hypothetical protein AB7G75_35100 [Candidatus Binatia bacterium]